jgi:diguanylate cyclase (GGDEF)-like protein
MKSVLAKSGAIAFMSSVASLLIATFTVRMTGGSVDGMALVLCVLCPILIAWPASAYSLSQSSRLRAAHRDLARAHAELAAAHRRLSEKARLDDMTGMLNREAFFAALDGSRRKTDRGSLLIIDADHFKRINDSFGHLTGDKALLEISSAILRGVRTGDFLGRIGGEEFAAFLVGADDREAGLVAERIRREVEMIRFRPEREATVPLTVSIGGTNCAVDASISELMRAADTRLYEAKRGGRNRAIVQDTLAAA